MQRKFLAVAVALGPLLGLGVGQVAAQTTISGATSTPVATSTANGGAPSDVIIASGGSITPTAPGAAVTLDSNNSVTNQGAIAFKDVSGVVGILVDGGFTGQVVNTGTISLSESYVAATDSNNDGLLTGPFAQGDNRIGIEVTGAAPFNGSIISAGPITIQGNTSQGIDLQAAITGSLTMLQVTPSTTAGVAATVANGAITITGDNAIGLNVAPGAGVGGDVRITSITVTGVGAQAAVIDGPVGGTVNISGQLSATGYRSTSRQTIPSISSLYTLDELQQGGPTLTIGANVAKGVIISAPPFPLSTVVGADVDGDGVPDASQGTGSVVQFGSAPALLIGAAGGVELGVHDPALNPYGLIIDGAVSANGLFDPLTSPNLPGVVAATAVQIGVANGGPVIIDGGFHITGSVFANSYQANATAIHIGAGATVPMIVNDGSISAASQQVNSTVAGATGAPLPVVVTGIAIDKGASVGAISNSNSITAGIGGTSGVGGAAVAIIDRSGTVASIANSGVISAVLNQTVVATPMPGTVTAIDISAGTGPQSITQSLSPAAVAATVYNSAATYAAGALVTESTIGTVNNANVTVTNVYEATTAIAAGQDPVSNPTLWKAIGTGNPSIMGDVRFGSGGSTFTVTAGTVSSGVIDMGAGTDTLTVNGTPTTSVNGVVIGGTSVAGSVQLGPGNSGQISLNVLSGTLSDTNPIAVRAGSINVGANGVLLVSADPAHGTNTDFIASGASSFANGAQLGLTLQSLQAAPVQTYVIVQTTGAGTLSAGTFGSGALNNAPYLYIANPSFAPSTVPGTPSEVLLTVTRRTPAQLGFNKAETSAFDAVLTALPGNAGIQQTILDQTTQAGLKSNYDQLLPDQGQGIFEALDSAAQAISSMTAARPDAGTPVAADSSLWLQEVNQRIDRRGVDSVGSNAKLLGLVGGYERLGVAGGAVGLTLSYFNAQESDSGAAVGQHVVASMFEAGAYYRRAMGPLTFTARGAGGFGWFSDTRRFVAPEVVDTATSAWHGEFAEAHAGLAYEQKLFGRYYARPEISADYLYLTEGAHAENGGGPGFDLNIASRASWRGSAQAILVLGAQYGTTSWLRPEIRVGWREILSGQVGDTVASFDGGSPFALSADQSTGGWATVGFSIKGGTAYSYVALEGDLDYRPGEERYDLRIAGRSAF
ncbi:MAG TPA: autotransporter outer membrane beta-barrel domain-containing protein [Caulobacteraceae bacterium]